MRLLTVISGTIICLTGVFCFAVYINPFSDVAFLIGLVMMLAGIMLTVSYLISGRGDKRLTDTALVEGLVTLLYGFAVINDQVKDNILIMFFGAWMTLCGITRISQSLYISRFNRRHWARVMPLGIVAAMIGVVMMMPSLLSSIMPLMLVGGAFVVNGLSMLVYAMFMRRKDADASRVELSARERAEARRQIKKAERQERESLRTLSSEERAAAKAKKLEEKRLLAESKKAEKAAKKEARKEEKTAEAVKSGLTIHVSKQEVEDIVSQAPEEQLKEDARVAAQAAAAVPESVAQAAAAEAAAKVSLKLPKDIPTVKVELEDPEEIALREMKETLPEVRVAAVNLEEIEKAPEIELPKVELPKLDLASEKAKVDREEVISQIENVAVPEAEVVDYTPLNLDELFADVPSKEISEEEQKKEKTRFTQVLSFDWSEPDFTEVKL
ncbi:MAG: hypothetical protein K6A91_04585 [Clostridia bacterium]|nr:hypothetical protein [Clostridia bacterium]